MFIPNKSKFEKGKTVKLLDFLETPEGIFIPPHHFRIEDVKRKSKNECLIFFVDSEGRSVVKELKEAKHYFEIKY